MAEFQEFGKIARLSRLCTITENIDGTNGLIYVGEDGEFQIGSKSRWLTPGKATDNFGFARWAYDHKDDLLRLGPGYHYGEWWGLGIQRGYGLKEKRFSLFNTFRWSDPAVRPTCCSVVPVLFEGDFSTEIVNNCLLMLDCSGSNAAPGFKQPEGVVIYHQTAKQYFKKTILNDAAPKGASNV